jgi:hypothetical protein
MVASNRSEHRQAESIDHRGMIFLLKTMPYLAKIPEIKAAYNGTVVGSGQCVAFVAKAAGAPPTLHWSRGKKVAGNLLLTGGTAIATFDQNGKYGNHTDGRSHAAIYVSQNSLGIQVYDQWLGQPVHTRNIAFHRSSAKTAKPVNPVNDGDAFYVIE